jgi:hypothetical protein
MWKNKELQTAATISLWTGRLIPFFPHHGNNKYANYTWTDGNRTLKTQAVSPSNLVANPNRKIKENGITLSVSIFMKII